MSEIASGAPAPLWGTDSDSDDAAPEPEPEATTEDDRAGAEPEPEPEPSSAEEGVPPDEDPLARTSTVAALLDFLSPAASTVSQRDINITSVWYALCTRKTGGARHGLGCWRGARGMGDIDRRRPWIRTPRSGSDVSVPAAQQCKSAI